MTELEARAAASLLPGINVRRHKGTWQFESRFHTTDGWHRRYAGKNLERAIELRAELIAAHAKRSSRMLNA
jgi:hypothetical protein